jgi:hypothetical protein
MADDKSIPDVDLSSVKAELEAEATENTDLGQFKNAEDLLKSYKEIQGAFTKVSQENKSLKDGGNDEEVQRLQAELASTKEQLELINLQPQAAQSPATKDFDESWMENPEATIDQRVAKQVALARIDDVLGEEDVKNPEEFQERMAYVNMLASNPQYANLGKTAAGVKRLFKEADKLRGQQLQQNSKKSLEHIFGEPLTDEHLAKLKKVVIGETKPKTKTNDAYMPEGSTSTKSGSDTEQVQDSETRQRDSVEKGDVDGVLDAIFGDILAE